MSNEKSAYRPWWLSLEHGDHEADQAEEPCIRCMAEREAGYAQQVADLREWAREGGCSCPNSTVYAKTELHRKCCPVRALALINGAQNVDFLVPVDPAQ